MKRYIALLRGVNISGKNKVPIASSIAVLGFSHLYRQIITSSTRTAFRPCIFIRSKTRISRICFRERKPKSQK